MRSSMQKNVFPMIAAGIGLLLALVLARSLAVGEGDDPLLPALTLLFICEFGFMVTAAGAWFGGRLWLVERGPLGLLLAVLGCVVLALAFLYVGLGLWVGVAPV